MKDCIGCLVFGFAAGLVVGGIVVAKNKQLAQKIDSGTDKAGEKLEELKDKAQEQMKKAKNKSKQKNQTKKVQ